MKNERESALELGRARQSLASARMLLDGGLLPDALSRTYYTVLHAAKAVLIAKGIFADSHEAVKRLFGLHCVKTGDIPAEFGIVFRKEQDDRLLADYDVAFEPERERVELRCVDAERFVEMVTEFISRLSAEL